jgi:hypothetical protein
MSKPVTITLGVNKESSPFRPLDIVLTNGNPLFKERLAYSIIYESVDNGGGQHSVKMRKLNTSRWKLIRYFEMKILRKLLKTKNF